MKSSQFAAFAVLSLLVAPLVEAGVTFEFTYPADDIADSRNWYDPTYGAFARSLLKKTMDDIGEELDSDAVITCLVVSFVPPTDPGFLAGAIGLSGKPVGNLNEEGSFSKIVNGVDLNGSRVDASFAWNFARGFTGSNGMLAYIPYVYNHELGHVLYAIGGSNPLYSRFNSFFYDSQDRPWIQNGRWTTTGLDAEENDANSYFRALDGTRYQIYRAGDVAHLRETFFNHPFNLDDRRIIRTVGYKLVPRLNVSAGNGQNFLSWNPTFYGTGYTIKRSTSVGGPYSTIGTTTTATTFMDTGLTNGTTYHYKVSASESGGLQSGDSMRKSATPGAGSLANLSFELPALGLGQHAYNPSGFGWTFSAQSGLTSAISGFTNLNVMSPDGFQSAFLQGTGTISQTLNNLTSGTSYRLSFSASQRGNAQLGQTFDLKLGNTVLASYSPIQADSAGQSIPIYRDYTVTFVPTSASQVLSFVGTNTKGGDNTIFLDQVRITAIETPTNLTASASGGNASLSWTAVAGATSYNVKRAATSGGFHTTVATDVTGTIFTEAISASSYYVVSAVNASGEGLDSNEASVITAPILDAPVITTSYATSGFAVLGWRPVSGASSYNVKRASTSGGPYTIISPAVTDEEFYEPISVPTYYIVTGVNSRGESKPSQEVVISPPLPPITAAELRAPKLVIANEQATISLATSVVGRTYQLQRSYALDSGSWVNLGTAKAGGGALDFFEAVDPAKKAAFYRIKIGP